jgi:hypothetical protein
MWSCRLIVSLDDVLIYLPTMTRFPFLPQVQPMPDSTSCILCKQHFALFTIHLIFFFAFSKQLWKQLEAISDFAVMGRMELWRQVADR